MAHKLMYFYRICNSSNRFLTAKTETFSCIVYVLHFVVPPSQVETIVQIFGHIGVEPYATLKVRKTVFFFLTMAHPWVDLHSEMPHHGEGEVIKCATNARVGRVRLELIKLLVKMTINNAKNVRNFKRKMINVWYFILKFLTLLAL